MKHFVYLAGPISGCSYEGATDWREYVISNLPDSIRGLDPMRGKKYLKDEVSLDSKLQEDVYTEAAETRAKGVLTRDRFDVMRSDLIFVNLLRAKRVSIGTVMEIAWADIWRIPVVVVMEEDNIHQHGMLTEAVGFIIDNLDDGIQLIRDIL
jgi:hypothetical protein